MTLSATGSTAPQTGETATVVVVGCGSEKQTGRTPARDLYTSEYFAKKREYAETIGDSWRVLSALYGSVDPTSLARPYDVTIDDYPLDSDSHPHAPYRTIDEWTEAFVDGIENSVHNRERWADWLPLGRVEILAGRQYVEPLREGLAALASENGFEVVYPFDDTEGIGEQLGWLTERIEAANAAATTGDGETAGTAKEYSPSTRVERDGRRPNPEVENRAGSGGSKENEAQQTDLTAFDRDHRGE